MNSNDIMVQYHVFKHGGKKHFKNWKKKKWEFSTLKISILFYEINSNQKSLIASEKRFGFSTKRTERKKKYFSSFIECQENLLFLDCKYYSVEMKALQTSTSEHFNIILKSNYNLGKMIIVFLVFCMYFNVG